MFLLLKLLVRKADLEKITFWFWRLETTEKKLNSDFSLKFLIKVRTLQDWFYLQLFTNPFPIEIRLKYGNIYLIIEQNIFIRFLQKKI